MTTESEIAALKDLIRTARADLAKIGTAIDDIGWMLGQIAPPGVGSKPAQVSATGRTVAGENRANIV